MYWICSQESPHFDRHITAAWLAVTLWDAPCCSSRAVSLPRAIESTCPDRKRRSATGRHSILLRWNHEIKMRGCLSPMTPPSNGITTEVIREIMPPYHLSADVLEATI